MIRSAAFKLTLWYLAIIMALSLSFSLIIYRISSAELVRDYSRQTLFMRLNPEFDDIRLRQIELGLDELRRNLFLLNLITLVLGGGASFLLARRTLQPIEDALEAQSRFTADASHELRTPLTAMQTEIEVALRNPKLSQTDARELLTSNLEEVAKLKALSEGLLRLAQKEGQDLANQTASLAVVARNAAKRLAPLSEKKGVKLENRAEEVLVQGDEASLTELAVILLDNAIKYSDGGTAVSIKALRHGRQAQLTVQDSGHGIKTSDLPHIFERFYRADTSRSKGRVDGYGLGLSIAQKIAALNSGTIDVASKPGKGSTFTVKLNLAKP